jgi:hypothetical protein
MYRNLPKATQRAATFLQILSLYFFAPTSYAIDFYAEALRTVNKEEISQSATFPSDAGGVVSVGVSFIPQISLEVSRSTENEYVVRGEDESGRWETVSTVKGIMYGLRARHPINENVKIYGKLGRQDLDLTMAIKENLLNFGPHHPAPIKNSADRYYYGVGAMYFLTPLVYLKADYIAFTESSKLFPNSSAAFSLKGKYAGAGIGIEW